jgi:hypothetical protein
MSGETRIVTFAEGTPTAAPPQTFLTTSAFQNYASDAAYVSAKASPASQGDAYFNTTDKTAHLYNNSYWAIIDSMKKNLTAIVNPTVTDDSASNYEVGSTWYNTTSETWHFAKGVGVGVALWSELIDKSSTQTVTGIKTFSAITTISNTTQSTTKDTGALIVEGGVGIEKNLYVGGNLVVTGDLTVDGTVTTINSTSLEVEDANILINNGGNLASANLLAGLTVEISDSTNATIIFASALASRWKLGDAGAEAEILTVSHTQTVTNKSYKASTNFVVDETDVTKRFKFDASSIATGTTRTLKMLNMDGTFVFIGTKAAITAHGRYEGALWYATDENKLYGDDGANLTSIGSGGGVSLVWHNNNEYAALEDTYFGQFTYVFTPGETQKPGTLLKVPNSYTPGSQIKLRIKIFSPTGSGDILIRSVATLIRSTIDPLSSTTNQRTSTNAAQAIGTANLEYVVDLDLTDSTGNINGVAVSANDSILISLSRLSDANTDVALFQPSTSEVLI